MKFLLMLVKLIDVVVFESSLVQKWLLIYSFSLYLLSEFGGSVNFPQFTMFPPCDPSILENNPHFKRLYTDLTTSVLNPDASTRLQSTSSAHTVVEVSRCIRQA